MTALAFAAVASGCLLVGLVLGTYLAARYEVDREEWRRELHRRYGGPR
jgi:hypothetical protein